MARNSDMIQEYSIMTVLIIGIILALISVAATLYQTNRTPDGAAEALAAEYWWMAWPM
jgi:hypothetical protein